MSLSSERRFDGVDGGGRHFHAGSASPDGQSDPYEELYALPTYIQPSAAGSFGSIRFR